jgi:D-beta-D-heptose 7-phosphate kinase/D-beta-D-heptose 1-phosphate adenosyltransferase
VTVVGPDAEGERLTRALAERGVMVQAVLREACRQTLHKQRLLAGSQMLVRFDEGSTDPIGSEMERGIEDALRRLWPEQDAVVVSDYDYGVVSPAIIAALGDLQARDPKVLLVDSKRLASFASLRPTAVKPNYEQAMGLLGGAQTAICADRAQSITRRGDLILEKTGARIAAVTLDHDGAVILERGCPAHRTHTRTAAHPTTAGAGDTFVGALALGLAAGGTTRDAADAAAAAAAIVVAKDGTSICTAEELARSLAPAGPATNLGALSAELERLRAQGKRVVLTNGCFDVIHRGHVDYLTRARALGDLLIVGLNSDESVRRLKGPGRP